ncbi:MAG TPA: hypothetical protein VMC82_00080 [Thermoplasmata archaeon]|nr:hypothetical protein [Thermoplasmata archaeon]
MCENPSGSARRGETELSGTPGVFETVRRPLDRDARRPTGPELEPRWRLVSSGIGPSDADFDIDEFYRCGPATALEAVLATPRAPGGLALGPADFAPYGSGPAGRGWAERLASHLLHRLPPRRGPPSFSGAWRTIWPR